MQRIKKELKAGLLLFFLAFAISGITMAATSTEVQAATKKNGFYIVNGQAYYYKNGTKVKGWQTINGKKYYFYQDGHQKQGWMTYKGKRYYFFGSKVPAERYMATGWATYKKNQYYFDKNGVMQTGWLKIGKNTYYLNPENGMMKTGWVLIGTDRYYFSTKGIMYKNKLAYDSKRDKYRYFASDGKVARGWVSFKSGVRYFSTNLKNSGSDGLMARGFNTIDGKTYYFFTEKDNIGFKATGWITRKEDGAKFYMDPANDGVMVTDTTKTIDGVKYEFDAKGVASEYKEPVEETEENNGSNTGDPTGTKTIKNYLKGALLPIGKAVYVWGGGWTQSTVKGVPKEWVNWYNSVSSSYDYNQYRDLTVGNRIKGLDCSGFVGWTAYQVMHDKSGEGYGYTVVSGSVGQSYVARGWGKIVTQADLAASNYKIVAGDVGYHSTHTWIMLGQCKDGSCVIVHSTPNAGVQLAGTPTPAGNYSSQAVALAQKYMKNYAGYNGKFAGKYKTSTGNYVRQGNFLRWNSSTLADPDGYRNMTADQILYDLYGY